MLPIKFVTKLFKPGKHGQWIAAIIVSLCAMSASLGFAWTSGAFPKIRRGEAGFSLDLNEQSWIASVFYVGNVISPIPLSYLMVHLGRRNALCCIIWLHMSAFVIISTTKGFWPLVVARILKGIWVGTVYTIVPVYVGECVDPKIRGGLSTFYSVFMYTGSLLVSFIGSYFSYSTLSWFSVVFNVALVIMLCLVPESPYFYLSKGDVSSARSSLAWLRGHCDEIVLNSIEESVKKSQKNKSTFFDIFKRPSTRKAFVISIVLGTIQRTSGMSVLLTFTSVTMPDYIITAEEFTIVLNCVWIASCFISGFVMDRFSRRFLMGFSCTGSSLTMFGVATWFYLRDKTTVDTTQVTWLPFALLALYGVAFSFGIASIPTMTPGEVFSPEIKSKASSLVSIWVALVSASILSAYFPLESNVGIYANFLICSTAGFFGVLCAIFVMIETRGKSIEEIVEELEGKPKIETRIEKSLNSMKE